MSSRKIWNYLLMAAEHATEREDRRTFRLGAVGLRQDGAIVMARNASTTRPTRKGHAEYRLSSKLDYGATVFVSRVVRIDNERQLANAKPCSKCRKVLRSRQVKKVYYTSSAHNYGIYYPLEDRFYERKKKQKATGSVAGK